MKRIWVTMTCDEGFVADSLRELAVKYEDELLLDEYELEHGTAQIEKYDEEYDPDLIDGDYPEMPWDFGKHFD